MKARSIGVILLGIYLVIIGVVRIFHLGVGAPALNIALAALAVVAGVFLLLGK